MSLIQAFVLGIVQGLTEFLPISSTAHLKVVSVMLGWRDPGAAFSAVIQLGSVVAVIWYFRQELWEIGSGCLQALQKGQYLDLHVRLAAAILLGTVPICLLGLALKENLNQAHGALRSLSVIGFASICMGVLLLLAEKLGKHTRGLRNLGARDGVLVGLAQCLALIPGCSRSGSTLTAAMLLNIKRDDAARFSFLLGIPAIVLAGLLEMKEAFRAGSPAVLHPDTFLVALSTSLVVSYLSIVWLIKYLQRHSTWIFIIYRFIFGSLVLYLVLR